MDLKNLKIVPPEGMEWYQEGVGTVKTSTGDRVILGILTFGPGALCDTETCETN